MVQITACVMLDMSFMKIKHLADLRPLDQTSLWQNIGDCAIRKPY